MYIYIYIHRERERERERRDREREREREREKIVLSHAIPCQNHVKSCFNHHNSLYESFAFSNYLYNFGPSGSITSRADQPVKYSTWRSTPARFLTKFRGKVVPKRLGERTYGIQSDEEKLCILGRSSSSVPSSSVARRPSLSVVWVLRVSLSRALASKTHNSVKNVYARINVSLSRCVSNQAAWMYWVLSFRRVELIELMRS